MLPQVKRMHHNQKLGLMDDDDSLSTMAKFMITEDCYDNIMEIIEIWDEQNIFDRIYINGGYKRVENVVQSKDE